MFICEGQLKCLWGSSFMMPKWSLMGVHLDACKSLKMEGWKGFCLYKNIDHMSIITQISFYMVQKIITQNLLLLQLEFFLAIRWTPDFTCVFFLVKRYMFCMINWWEKKFQMSVELCPIPIHVGITSVKEYDWS